MLHSWRTVVNSCNQGLILSNLNPDPDNDLLESPADLCPTLSGIAAAKGCPERERTLSLKYKKRKGAFVGKLKSPDYPSLRDGVKVTVWKQRPGPDKKVGTTSTKASGAYKLERKRKPGKYYAVAPAIVVPTAGMAAAETSPVRKIKK